MDYVRQILNLNEITSSSQLNGPLQSRVQSPITEDSDLNLLDVYVFKVKCIHSQMLEKDTYPNTVHEHYRIYLES